jgi:4-amino-4-deoxy-L-arabinose transferase-like glycosyltransferase
MSVHDFRAFRTKLVNKSVLSAALDNRIFLWGAFIILVATIFFRFYQLENRMQFNYDQVENAWMMKNMRINGQFPLLGMQAKGNSGFYIGPLYYYLLYPFYLLTNLDPIGAGYFAGVVSVVTIVVILFTARSLFGTSTSLITGCIYTLSCYVVHFDRIAWPVVLIPLVSILTYYFLIRVLEGRTDFIIPLGLVVGFSFHVHFTAIFFPIIILCSLPFVAISRKTLLYGGIALLCFVVFQIPSIVANIQTGGAQSNNFALYMQTYFHGVHLRRIIQLIPDGFLEFSSVLGTNQNILDYLRYLYLPIFSFFLLTSGRLYGRRIVYVSFLFFLVPLFVFSTYKGELTNYYYSPERPIAVLIVGYILATLIHQRRYIAKIAVIIGLVWYGFINLQLFSQGESSALSTFRARAIGVVNGKQYYPFRQGDQVSYLSDYYHYKRDGTWPK